MSESDCKNIFSETSNQIIHTHELKIRCSLLILTSPPSHHTYSCPREGTALRLITFLALGDFHSFCKHYLCHCPCIDSLSYCFLIFVGPFPIQCATPSGDPFSQEAVLFSFEIRCSFILFP